MLFLLPREFIYCLAPQQSNKQSKNSMLAFSNKHNNIPTLHIDLIRVFGCSEGDDSTTVFLVFPLQELTGDGRYIVRFLLIASIQYRILVH